MDMSCLTNHSSSMSRKSGYEVFLSFRGIDTRRNFADFLHTMLTDAGIQVFRDKENLGYGEEIHPKLIQAIEQSRISIPVISENFASSKSCLMELAQMVDCMDKKNHIIIPIFYYVKPTDVCNCPGPFKGTFDEHLKRGGDATLVKRWESALHRIGDLKGCHLHENQNVYHTEVIKQIVREVQQMLKKKDLIVTKQLVGVDPHVQEIMAKLKVEYCDEQAVKIGDTCGKVLIYGIPGVGKTVLAKSVYNKLHHLYDACSFLEKIQEEIERGGVLSVQNKLISHLHKGNALTFDCSDKALTHIQSYVLTMKVLLLLDDVKDHAQLSALFGELDSLGPGSTVIVTSQRDDVLKKLEGAKKFGLRTMQQNKALTLFSRHAFGEDSPPEEFKGLAREIVAATDGLSLELENVGQSLFQEKNKKVWTEKLNELKEAPYRRVQAALSKSYNTLEKEGRNIFLDIACFVNGKDKRIPYYMWNDLNFYPTTSIQSLCALSFVEIREDEELRMCRILKTFGREIVKRENENEPCRRSRLCNHEEALDVLRGRKGTEHVEALGLEFGDGYDEERENFKCDRFDGLSKLRFLKLDQAVIWGDFGDHFSRLRWLDWQGCPKIFYGHLYLNLPNLVILDLSRSQVDEDWSGWELLAEGRRLKVLNLTGCVQLKATPKFPPSMELERLILEDCSNLAIIDPSVGNLTKLVSLNVKGCSLLCEWPDLGPMSGLKELVIDGTSISRINVQEGSMKTLKSLRARNCETLTEISDSIRYLESLKYLYVDGSKIDTLPESIGSLEKLKTLSVKNCQRLTDLPNGIGGLSSLQLLDLSYTAIKKLPTSVEDLKDTKVLWTMDTFIQDFPETILNLEEREEIDVSLCRELEGEINFDVERLSSLA